MVTTAMVAQMQLKTLQQLGEGTWFCDIMKVAGLGGGNTMENGKVAMGMLGNFVQVDEVSRHLHRVQTEDFIPATGAYVDKHGIEHGPFHDDNFDIQSDTDLGAPLEHLLIFLMEACPDPAAQANNLRKLLSGCQGKRSAIEFMNEKERAIRQSGGNPDDYTHLQLTVMGMSNSNHPDVGGDDMCLKLTSQMNAKQINNWAELRAAAEKQHKELELRAVARINSTVYSNDARTSTLPGRVMPVVEKEQGMSQQIAPVTQFGSPAVGGSMSQASFGDEALDRYHRTVIVPVQAQLAQQGAAIGQVESDVKGLRTDLGEGVASLAAMLQGMEARLGGQQLVAAVKAPAVAQAAIQPQAAPAPVPAPAPPPALAPLPPAPAQYPQQPQYQPYYPAPQPQYQPPQFYQPQYHQPQYQQPPHQQPQYQQPQYQSAQQPQQRNELPHGAKFESDGAPICVACGKTGHIIRGCPDLEAKRQYNIAHPRAGGSSHDPSSNPNPSPNPKRYPASNPDSDSPCVQGSGNGEIGAPYKQGCYYYADMYPRVTSPSGRSSVLRRGLRDVNP